MSYYADDQERARLIAGLRDLAEFLDQNPQVPAPRYTDLLVFPPSGTDAEMFAEIDVIAEQIGATASDADSPAGHYSASRDFGPVQYRAVAIPHSARTTSSEGGGIAMLHLILCSAVLVAAAAHGRPGRGHHRHPPQRARQAAHRPARRPQRNDRPPAAGRLARLRPARRREGRPAMSRMTDLTAAVVVSARHCTEPGCAQVPRPVPLAAPQGVALPQVPEPLRPRPEEVM